MTLPSNAEPIILRPGEGEYVVIGGNSRCTFKVTGRDTSNHFGLFEFEMEPEAVGARPHTHQHLTEIFYVIDGEVQLLAGHERVNGTKGTLLLVPPATIHGFSNSGNTRAILLIMFCPADSREKYFEGLAELTKDGRRPTRDELVSLMHRFDQQPVEGIEFP
jgi:quercetin dioxygenase-like cupin family protein